MRAAALLALSALVVACGDSGAAGVSGVASDGRTRAAPERPNLVLILVDTLRQDHLGMKGYGRETTPFLASLASRSVLFPRAFSSSSWTAPSTASVFTGLYPTRHGVQEGFWAHKKEREEVDEEGEATIEINAIPESLTTLPERLRAAGYGTFGVASNLNIGKRIGFSRGFDHFEKDKHADAEQLAAWVRGWRDAMEGSQPYLLYMHVNDAHMPYEAREPWYEPQEDPKADAIARYDSEVRYIDHVLGELWDEMGWERTAIVTVVSDHGEEFGDRGGFGHTFSLHSELNDVLTLVHDPFGGGEPRRVDVPTSLVDICPTLLEFAGVAADDDLDGRSLAPLVRGGAEALARFAPRLLFAHRTRQAFPYALWAVVDGRWKLIENDRDDTIELYDLEADPREQRDLASEEPEVAAELRARLDEFQRTSLPVEGAHGRVEVPLDRELLEHLESIGYTGGDEGE